MSSVVTNIDSYRDKKDNAEKGYTKIPNDILDAIMLADLTKHQLKVVMAVLRKTYGFHKGFDRISDSQLSELTKLPRQKVNKAKNELISMNILIKSGKNIGLNKTIYDWKIEKCHRNSDNLSVTETVTKSVTKTVTALSPKRGHTKETITKEKKEKEKNIKKKKSNFDVSSETVPNWLSKSVWQDWLNYRRELRHPIKTKLTFDRQIQLLSKCYELGISPENVINNSITNGWIGLFEPREPQSTRNQFKISEPCKADIFITEDF